MDRDSLAYRTSRRIRRSGAIVLACTLAAAPAHAVTILDVPAASCASAGGVWQSVGQGADGDVWACVLVERAAVPAAIVVGNSPDPIRHPSLSPSMVAAVMWEGRQKGVGTIPLTDISVLDRLGYALDYAEHETIEGYLQQGYSLNIMWGPIAVPVTNGMWAGLAWNGTSPQGHKVYGVFGEVNDVQTAQAVAAATPQSPQVQQQAQQDIAQTLALSGIAIAAGMAFVNEGLSIFAGQPVVGAILTGIGLALIGLGTGAVVGIDSSPTATVSGPVGPGSSSAGIPGSADNSPSTSGSGGVAGPGPSGGGGSTGDSGVGDE
jgi:hypothetical protein